MRVRHTSRHKQSMMSQILLRHVSVEMKIGMFICLDDVTTVKILSQIGNYESKLNVGQPKIHIISKLIDFL